MPSLDWIGKKAVLASFQQPVDLNLVPGAEVNAAIDDHGNDEARSQRRAVACGIFLRRIDGVSDVRGVVGIENGRTLSAVPRPGGDNPDDCIPIPIG